jgi:hypothetical protein
MQFSDERNLLRIGPAARPGDAEITPAMVDVVRQRIKDAGGILTVWAVLNEDVYETKYGDGFYLHVHGIALNSVDAQRLAELVGESEFTKWHVKDHRIGLKDNVPVFLAARPLSDEFTINNFVEILSEIPANGTASKLQTGSGSRKNGPLLALS